MLFDLSSPGRKNVIRVVYGVLAFLFLLGFVGFGIGGELGSGGIIDSLTGGGGGGSTAEQFEDQIEDAEKQLETDPENPQALEELIRLRFQSGYSQLEFDETGSTPVALTEESRKEFEAAVEAWNTYLATDPKKPDLTAATNMSLAFQALGDFGGAADAQEVAAEASPSAQTYTQLAVMRWQDFDFKAGDAAAARAKEEARPAEQKQVERQLEAIRKQAVKLEKQQGSVSEGSEGAGLQNPFGGLSPDGGAVPPTAP